MSAARRIANVITGKPGKERIVTVDQWPYDALASLQIHGARNAVLDLGTATVLRDALTAFIDRGPVDPQGDAAA